MGFGRMEIDDRYDAVRSHRHDAANETSQSPNRLGNSSDQLQAEYPVPERQGYSDDIRLRSDLESAAAGTSSDQAIWIEPGDQGTASRPRYLCFIKDYDQALYETIHVSQYIFEHGDNIDMEFVFVSYTREQFRVATDDEIDKYKYPNEETREANRQLAKRDRKTLIRWGIDAAKRAGKKAFWIDFECVRDEDGVARSTSKSDDVYRICDVVRAAHSMIIAIGPPASDKVNAILAGQSTSVSSGAQQTTKWLRHWGSRLWTLPELLLCPGEHRIRLYVGDEDSDPVSLAKRNFAERAWEDAELVKELVNHYEGSAILTQLRLLETALACFARRGTDQFSPGDIAYAIMGLLPHSQRPTVRQEDSGFQAFARLSLANDGGDFLGRLICLLSTEGEASWHQSSDVWGAKVSDVRPTCHITKVLDSDTLLVDSLYGAAIQWDGFGTAAKTGELSNGVAWKTLAVLMMFSGLMSIAFMSQLHILGAFSRVDLSHFGSFSIILLGFVSVPPMISALILPILYILSRRRTLNPFKAHLVGIEGHVDAGAIERHLWGHNYGRFTTIASGTAFLDNPGEENHLPPRGDDLRAFTLVDTHMMSVLHFYARSPPVAMLIAGQEGGMQRALLCSYHWQSGVFLKETVARVGTQMLDKMRRVDRFRLGLSARKEHASQTVSGVGQPKPDIIPVDDSVIPWKAEWMYLMILLVSTKRQCPGLL